MSASEPQRLPEPSPLASDVDGGNKRVALTMGQLVDVEITAPDAGWLVDLTRRLISDRLVASGNIAPVRSRPQSGDHAATRPG